MSTAAAVHASAGFADWLRQRRLSLAVACSKPGKLLLIGTGPDGRLSIFERNFPLCRALWASSQTLWLASGIHVWRLENVLDEPTADGFDRCFVPRAGFTTGELDVADLAADAAGRPVFASPRFDCVATLHRRLNFTPIWRPNPQNPWDRLDCRHLTGLAVEGTRLRCATAWGGSDEPMGWWAGRKSGGVLLDAETGAPLATGLALPSAPRLQGDRVWLLESGAGRLGHVDFATRQFTPTAFCPGFATALELVDGWAVAGVSTPPTDDLLYGLPLHDELARRQVPARCGLQLIELAENGGVEWLRLDGLATEIGGVGVVRDARRPKALGFFTDEIAREIRFEDAGAVRTVALPQR